MTTSKRGLFRTVRTACSRRFWLTTCGWCGILLLASQAADSVAPIGRASPMVSGTNGGVATGHPMATAAAIRALQDGGNAIDGAVAAALTLGVVDGHNSGIGGGCFLMIRTADGQVVAIDGRETAPAQATRDMFVQAGRANPERSQTGALAVGVPGALAAYDLALRQHGRRTLRDHLLLAAQLAEDGFRLDATYARQLAETAKELRAFAAARSIFLKANGAPWRRDDLLRQPDLAQTYRAIAAQGIDWFYRGPFAEATQRWMQENHGLLAATDFAAYQARRREPVTTTYRGYRIVGFPPPSSGGVHVGQILNLLEPFDLKALGAGSAAFVHIVTEAMKRAFADRAFWLGDPDFVPVPRGLLSKEYASSLAKPIRLDRAEPVPGPGTPPRPLQDVFGKHTTHFSVADRAGNWVAATATINTAFGSKVVVPGTGVLLNNQMDDFSAQPGVPNYFGLVGSAANAVAPGKRPLSSMSPTIVLRDGQPVVAVGAAGGPTIISQVVLALIHVIDFGLPLDAALAQPRFHHQWKPDELHVERNLDAAVIRALEKRGHKVVIVPTIGLAQAVRWDAATRTLVGVADPRGEGAAGSF